MQRREMLKRIGAVGAIGAGAGCLGGDSNEDAPAAGDGALSITDQSIQTVGSQCGDSGTHDASDNGDGTISFTGTIVTPNPCHVATLENVAVDGSTVSIEVNAKADDSKDVCQQCIGAIDYEGTISYEGGSPSEISMTNQNTEM